jgi:hypothetical protein
MQPLRRGCILFLGKKSCLSERKEQNMKLNIQKSQEIGRLIHAERKACWRNVLLALLSVEELADFHYVEGWVFYGIPFNHGWLQNEVGEVIDPTLTLGEIQGEIQYFPGKTYSAEEAQALLDIRLPAVENDGRGGFTHPGYRAAYEAALAAANAVQ